MDGDTSERPSPYRSPGAWKGVLHRALPNLCCRACESQNWDALAPDWDGDEQVGVLHFAHWKTGQLIGYIGSVAFACRKCGNIELFAENYLLALAVENDLQADEIDD